MGPVECRRGPLECRLARASVVGVGEEDMRAEKRDRDRERKHRGMDRGGTGRGTVGYDIGREAAG